MDLPDFSQFVEDLGELERTRVVLDLNGVEAFCLLAQLQLAFRHPLNEGPSRAIVERIARVIQDRVSVTPALAAAAEAGWHEEHDQEWEENIDESR